MKRKLLLIGSDSIHIYNYEKLIAGYFNDVLLISNKINPAYNGRAFAANFSLKSPLNYITTLSQIKRIIQEYKPSIIHIHQANSYAYYALKASQKFKIPKVITAWGSDVLLLPEKNFLMKRMVKYNLTQASALTSDSEFMGEKMRKLIPEKKLDILIANFGVDTPSIHLNKENIIYSNRLHNKLYRIEDIIKAFYKFLHTEKGKDWKLIIAGVGSETENLRELVKKLTISNQVEFHGWVNKEQNMNLYARAKLFVSIPESDATAISLLEAMAHGCLPIVSDLPANKEWIHHKRNGIIVNKIEENFFSQALLLDLNKATVLNAEIVKERATKEANRKKFLSLYDRLLTSV